MSEDLALCLVFHAGTDAFFVPALDVHKIVDAPTPTRLPRLHRAIAGAVHHRGRVVTMVDLAALLTYKAASQLVGRAARMLLFERPGSHIGVRVDRVEGITRLPLARIEERASRGQHPVSGLLSQDGRVLQRLDVDGVLAWVDGLEDRSVTG